MIVRGRRRVARRAGKRRAAAGDPAAACIAPHDTKTGAALAKAATKMTAAVCRACGGSDKRCGGAATDDLQVADVGLPALCPYVAVPGEADSCAGEVASLGDAVDCLACTTRYRADCVALAADASAHPLPAACTHAALCDPGYTGAACTTLLPEVVPELAKLPDPASWLTDGKSGARYRRATRRERLRYGWLPGTFLVEAKQARADATAGASTVELALPTADGEVHHVLFDLASAERGEQMIEVRGEVSGKARAKAAFPLFLNYLSRTKLETSFEALVRLVVVEDGGAAVRGMAGSRWLDGYLPTGTLELDPSLTTPNSPHPGQLVVLGVRIPDAGTAAGWNQCHGEGICGAYCNVQAIGAPCSADVSNPCCEPYDPDGQPSDDCHDGFDNDFDGKIDEGGSPSDNSCRHSEYCTPNGTLPTHTHPREAGKQFILLGEIHLCSWFADQLKDWRVEMHVRAEHIVHGYEGETGYDPYHYLADHRMGLRFVTAKCWILDDLEQARECKDGALADCDPFDAAPHVYPYAGAGNSSGNYLFEMPRADMAHAVTVGLWQPVNLVQVLMATGKGQQLVGGTSPSVAGRAEAAYSVAKYTDTYTSENFNVSNHELGHSLGFTHCDAELSPIDNVCTIMGDDHNTTGSCQLSEICNVPDGHARLSADNAEALYGALRSGTVLPYHFGNAP